jgi:peroxiredoxin
MTNKSIIAQPGYSGRGLSKFFASLVGFAALSVICFAPGTSLPVAQAEVTIGKLAPAFSLPGADGKQYSLEDLRGKFVVLEWLNYDCPYVRKHYESKNIQTLQRTYGEKGVMWFAVNSSAPGKQGHLTAESALRLASEKGAAATTTLLDPSGDVGKLYGARTTPHMYVINPEGIVVYAGAIDDNDSTRLSSVEGAKNYVATALDEAMAGKKVSTTSTSPYGCSVKYAA